MVDGVRSDDPSIQSEYASKFKKFLLDEENPPIDKIIESGVAPRFVEFLKKEDNIELQMDAATVLRIISEENTKVLIDHGAIQIFVHLLASAAAAATDSLLLLLLRMEATTALGNVACASVESRDYVLRCGALSPLLAQLHENADMWMLRTAASTLSAICSVHPRPPFRQMEPALYALQRVLHRNDEQFLSAACWTLYFLSHGPKEYIQSFIDAGLVPRLVQLLGNNSPSVIDRALGTIMYLTTGDNQQTKVVIECGVLPLLADLLTQDYAIRCQNIKRDACWAISNITAGTEEEIQLVIDANLIPKLVNLAQNAEFDIIKEKAVRAISHAALGGSNDQIRYLVEQGCIKPLCDLLVCPEPEVIFKCLYGLENILMAGEAERNIGGVNYFSQQIEDAEGLEKIKNLKQHVNNMIYLKAMQILETYWAEEDDEQT
ncbi:PREDICTED: importin subunit alpha-1-like [Camelina sativa]|uniref:Importin subunit alpha-1-like n=1 Tax=Camelina sativa TaxID=90675 RepID=A0ABM0UKA8_CAMSA|nr:PREDICTED: importin subunit alpha-1-like [Camelina sativa]